MKSPKSVNFGGFASPLENWVWGITQKTARGKVMVESEHLKLAYGVVNEGEPFFSGGAYGIRKGVISVQLKSGTVQLICGGLMPVHLKATGVPEDDETLRKIESAIQAVSDNWLAS